MNFTIIQQIRKSQSLVTKFKWWERLAAWLNRTKPEVLFKHKALYSYRISLKLDKDFRINGGRRNDVYLIGNNHWVVAYTAADIIDVYNLKPVAVTELRGRIISLFSTFAEGSK